MIRPPQKKPLKPSVVAPRMMLAHWRTFSIQKNCADLQHSQEWRAHLRLLASINGLKFDTRMLNNPIIWPYKRPWPYYFNFSGWRIPEWKSWKTKHWRVRLVAYFCSLPGFPSAGSLSMQVTSLAPHEARSRFLIWWMTNISSSLLCKINSHRQI